jgi:DNA-binding response OmpR family regulator
MVTMKKLYLSIEKNTENFEIFRSLWKKYGIDGIKADTMSEGIEKALEIEKSKNADLYFISISADDINYLPQLGILSNETITPILIATSRPQSNEREDSFNGGADYYGGYLSTPEENIKTVIAVINSIERRAKKIKKPNNRIIAHRDLLIVADNNKAYINDLEIPLTSMDSDLFYLFVHHRGYTLSHEQIYQHVNRDMTFDLTADTIYAIIKRLRKKIRDVTQTEYIETVRGVGYRFKGKNDLPKGL